MSPRRSRNRDQLERGAVAVEAAFLTPVIVALFFGILEFGFLFKDYLATYGTVKAGARVASAIPRNASFSQAAADEVQQIGGGIDFASIQQLWVYKVSDDPTSNKPIGFTDYSDCTTCVKFRWDAGTGKFVKIVDNWPATAQNACSTVGGPPDRLGVYLQVKHDALTRLVFNSITISEASVMTLEPIPTLQGCK
jgi:Flp pilus assembly protein TadG